MILKSVMQMNLASRMSKGLISKPIEKALLLYVGKLIMREARFTCITDSRIIWLPVGNNFAIDKSRKGFP